MKILLALLATILAAAAEPLVLDAANKSVKKFSTSDSMMGIRNTLLFYTFTEQKAILRVMIDNKDTKFPITATVYKFAADASEESLDKWINNQHSDALFIDAAEPLENHPLPADGCSVISHKLIERTAHHNGEHDNYEVKFRIGGFSKEAVFELKKFDGEANVHVKVAG